MGSVLAATVMIFVIDSDSANVMLDEFIPHVHQTVLGEYRKYRLQRHLDTTKKTKRELLERKQEIGVMSVLRKGMRGEVF